MKTISLRLPNTLSTRLTAAAKRRGESKSAIIRKALEAYLARSRGPAPTSFATRAKEFIGCVDGGPPDLSTNKKYMEGFGRSRGGR